MDFRAGARLINPGKLNFGYSLDMDVANTTQSAGDTYLAVGFCDRPASISHGLGGISIYHLSQPAQGNTSTYHWLEEYVSKDYRHGGVDVAINFPYAMTSSKDVTRIFMYTNPPEENWYTFFGTDIVYCPDGEDLFYLSSSTVEITDNDEFIFTHLIGAGSISPCFNSAYIVRWDGPGIHTTLFGPLVHLASTDFGTSLDVDGDMLLFSADRGSYYTHNSSAYLYDLSCIRLNDQCEFGDARISSPGFCLKNPEDMFRLIITNGAVANDTINKLDILVYPNPCDGFITISLQDQTMDLSDLKMALIKSDGQYVWDKPVESYESTIPIQDNSIYYLYVYNDHELLHYSPIVCLDGSAGGLH